MSTVKRLLNPERLRQMPAHFSWLDHRLVQEHYIERADVCAWALYLFLVTVASGMASCSQSRFIAEKCRVRECSI